MRLIIVLVFLICFFGYYKTFGQEAEKRYYLGIGLGNSSAVYYSPNEFVNFTKDGSKIESNIHYVNRGHQYYSGSGYRVVPIILSLSKNNIGKKKQFKNQLSFVYFSSSSNRGGNYNDTSRIEMAFVRKYLMLGDNVSACLKINRWAFYGGIRLDIGVSVLPYIYEAVSFGEQTTLDQDKTYRYFQAKNSLLVNFSLPYGVTYSPFRRLTLFFERPFVFVRAEKVFGYKLKYNGEYNTPWVPLLNNNLDGAISFGVKYLLRKS